MEVESESTEDRIIHACFKILQTEGASGATTKKIASEAQVNEVTIFRKFKTKKNLIKIAKDQYTQYLIEKLDAIFDYDDEIEIDEYLKTRFYQVVNLSDNELNIIKVAMEEVRNIPFEDKVILQIAERIIGKLEEYFSLQMSKGKIRKINANILALNVYCIIFESIILWKVYGKTPRYSIDEYANDFLDIILNGISN